MDDTYFVLSQMRTGSYYVSNLLDEYYTNKRGINRLSVPLTELALGAEYHLPATMTEAKYVSNCWHTADFIRTVPDNDMIPFVYDSNKKLIVRSGNRVHDNRIIHHSTYTSVADAARDNSLSSYKIMINWTNKTLLQSLKHDFGIKCVCINRDPYEMYLSILLAQANDAYQPTTSCRGQNLQQRKKIDENFAIRCISRIQKMNTYMDEYIDCTIEYNDVISDPCSVYNNLGLTDYEKYVDMDKLATKPRYTSNKELFISNIEDIQKIWNNYFNG